MIYVSKYSSPLGKITLASEEDALVGLWFDGQKHFGSTLTSDYKEIYTPVLEEASFWLNIYFSGKVPDFLPKLKYGRSDFQKIVCDCMLEIPYGKTTTYGEIALSVAKSLGLEKMSAQAVGGAVGRNPISIIIPCHRVVGARGKLTGYAGGIDKKLKLLELEKTNLGKA